MLEKQVFNLGDQPHNEKTIRTISNACYGAWCLQQEVAER